MCIIEPNTPHFLSIAAPVHQEKWFLPFLALYPNRDSMGYISIYMRYSCNLSDIELDFHYIL